MECYYRHSCCLGKIVGISHFGCMASGFAPHWLSSLHKVTGAESWLAWPVLLNYLGDPWCIILPYYSGGGHWTHSLICFDVVFCIIDEWIVSESIMSAWLFCNWRPYSLKISWNFSLILGHWWFGIFSSTQKTVPSSDLHVSLLECISHA